MKRVRILHQNMLHHNVLTVCEDLTYTPSIVSKFPERKQMKLETQSCITNYVASYITVLIKNVTNIIQVPRSHKNLQPMPFLENRLQLPCQSAFTQLHH